MRIMRLKLARLKIAEQLVIVFFFSILIPLIVAAIIVLNVNQHAVRSELKYSSLMTAENIYNQINTSLSEKIQNLNDIKNSFKYINSDYKKQRLLEDIKNSSDDITDISIVELNKNVTSGVEIDSQKDKKLVFYSQIKDNKYLKAQMDFKSFQDSIFENFKIEKRQIYIIDNNKNIIMSYNENLEHFNSQIKYLPNNIPQFAKIEFGEIKNQPNFLIKLSSPEWTIITLTPEEMTFYSIIKARHKIILALLISSLITFIIGALYALTLYTNIRQLFKAIGAISQGNYKKRIRLIKNMFTPREVVFLADEFNLMIKEIYSSYRDLQRANNKLSKLDDIKSNLIDTVSHEFRTPLTCINGYTSRLLRSDIELDEETKQKSLKVIKQQTERLGRMVEDLLVIPDLEKSNLSFIEEEVDLNEVLERSILSIQQKQQRQVNKEIRDDFPLLWCDSDRIEQVIINLLDNAVKYSPEASPINVKTSFHNDFANISIQNECPFNIKQKDLDSLFEKFSRIDDKLTRTTRGTGLGLFISKGLVEGMGGKIELSIKNGFTVNISIPCILVENNEPEAMDVKL